MLRGKNLAAGFTGIGRIVGNKELIGIAKEIDLIIMEIAKLELRYTLSDRSQAGIFIFNGIA